MNLRTRLKRAACGALAATVVLSAGAFAQTSSEVPVTVGNVTGTRSLQVTGSDGVTVGGPLLLAFGGSATSAPFGTLVTDLTYERVGYDLYATLSDLYPLSGTSVDCTGTPIPAQALSVGDLSSLTTTDLDAALDSVLDLADADIQDDLVLLEGVTGISLSGVTPVSLTDVRGLVESVQTAFADQVSTVIATLEGLTFMNTAAGAGGTFGLQDAHPASGCESSGAADPTEVYLQTGSRNDPDLTQLTSDIFTAAAGGATSTLTVAEAMADSLLPSDATATTSTLFAATRSAVETALLNDPLISSLTGIDVDATTSNVIDDLVAQASGLTLSLAGQSGVYPNVQALRLDRDQMGTPATGTYHGVMTVTLIDDPTNDPS